MAAARNLLAPQAPRPYAPVPYFWSDQYDLRLQAHGYLRGHDESVVVDGDTAARRALVAYRTGDRLVGVAAVGMPPSVLRAWRSRLLQAVPWSSVMESAAAS